MSGTSNQNLSDVYESPINQLKKPRLKKIVELKSRMIVDAGICSLCNQIKDITKNVSRLLGKNDQLNSDLAVC